MKFKNLSKCCFFLLTIFFRHDAFAQSYCQKFDGNWNGNMSGRFAGPVKMVIDKCSITWSLPDGRTNYCTIFENLAKNEYRCSLGSRGTVDLKNKAMTIKNIYTGNDYVVSVSRQ